MRENNWNFAWLSRFLFVYLQSFIDVIARCDRSRRRRAVMEMIDFIDIIGAIDFTDAIDFIDKIDSIDKKNKDRDKKTKIGNGRLRR